MTVNDLIGVRKKDLIEQINENHNLFEHKNNYYLNTKTKLGLIRLNLTKIVSKKIL